MDSPSVLSLFAGIGGICLGFTHAGFNVIFATLVYKMLISKLEILLQFQ